MAVRDGRRILKSLFSPGSKCFYRLKNDTERLYYIGLVLWADDYGRLEGTKEDVKAIFPKSTLSEKQTEEILKSLARVGLIDRYKVNGETYIEIVKFEESQTWHGVQREDSKILPNPKAKPATITRGIPQQPSLETPSTMPKTHEPHKDYPYPYTYPKETYPKPSGVETGTAAESSRNLDNGMGPDEAYRLAKRAYRLVVGKSIGSIGNRGGQWGGLVEAHGGDAVVRAVQIWADEIGKDGKHLRWPLAVFLKNAEEFIETAKDEGEQQAKEKQESARESEEIERVKARLDREDAKAEEQFAEMKRKREEEEKVIAGISDFQ